MRRLGYFLICLPVLSLMISMYFILPILPFLKVLGAALGASLFGATMGMGFNLTKGK